MPECNFPVSGIPLLAPKNPQGVSEVCTPVRQSSAPPAEIKPGSDLDCPSSSRTELFDLHDVWRADPKKGDDVASSSTVGGDACGPPVDSLEASHLSETVPSVEKKLPLSFWWLGVAVSVAASLVMYLSAASETASED